jgi:ABC-type transport system substrate-binding protein
LERPIGTGAYKVSAWIRGDSLAFTANPEYWGEPPNAANLIFRWQNDSDARLLEIQSGAVDGIDDVAATDATIVISDSNLSLLTNPTLNTFYIGMTNTFAPFDDQRVRQAIAMGIDRERIVENFMPFGYEVASHFTPCEIQNGCAGEDWHPFDPDAALALLAEAGYPDGFTINLYYRDVVRSYLPEPEVVAQDIQDQLRNNLGINIDLVVMDSGAFFEAVLNGRADGLYLLGWGGSYPHISDFLDINFNETILQFGAQSSSYTEPIALASQNADPAKTAQLYTEANNAIRDYIPMIPVAHSRSLLAYRADVRNQQTSPFAHENFALVNPGGRDTFIWMQNGEPSSLFCADETDDASLRACAQVMESLYSYQGADVKPALAESCEPNADMTTWVCNLRQGVVFHDGTTFDANDVVTTFTMGLDASSPLHVGSNNTWDYYGFLWGLINQP